MGEFIQRLFSAGVALMRRFCEANGIQEPGLVQRSKADWPFRKCAAYRPCTIRICVEACAGVGVAGRAWSYPGYTVDRTPFGAIQHELGHHVDVACSSKVDRFRGDFSARLRAAAGEKPISGYCPDDGEWFAEMFRLFVTNPDLLRILRPRTYALISARFSPVVDLPWLEVLAHAPARTKALCARRVAEAC